MDCHHKDALAPALSVATTKAGCCTELARQTHPAEIVCSDAKDSDLWEAPEKDGPTMEASPKATGFGAMIRRSLILII